jgi:WD40 repeat protein
LIGLLIEKYNSFHVEHAALPEKLTCIEPMVSTSITEHGRLWKRETNMRIRFKRNKIASLVLMGFLLVMTLGCTSSPASSSDLTVFSQSEGGIPYDGHSWSPDGQWLASESADAAKISLFSARGQLVNELRLGCDLGNGGGDFSWLPDGRLSCFIGNEPPLLDVIGLDQKGNVKQSTMIPVPINSGTVTYAMQWNPHHLWLATIAESAPGEGAASSTLYLSDLQGHSTDAR